MSTKFTLNTVAMEEDFFSGTALVGIGSPLPVYRLCWLLNERLGTKFVRQPIEQDIILQSPKAEEHYFPLYRFEMPMQGSKYSLYKLKAGTEVLLPEIKQLDYLWMIESASAEDEAYTIVGHLKTLPDIQLAQVLSPDKLKHLNHLIV